MTEMSDVSGRVPKPQFPICPPPILVESVLTSLFSIHYSLFSFLPYPVPPAILEAIREAFRRALPSTAPWAIR